MRRPSLVEAEIAAVLNTVNTGEIDLGNLMLTRARTTLARDFARSMVNEHSAADERQAALFRSLGIAPSDSELRAQLERESRRVRALLEGANPATIDITYARSQADIHDTVLRLFDETLLPSAVQAEVRVELMLSRSAVQHHFTRAMTLVEALKYSTGADAGVDDGGVDDAGL
jgi:putative membrane protein